jgi:predicted permease
MQSLDALLAIFSSTLLPVLLLALAGYLLAAFVPLDTRTIGRVLFYLATPALVFRSLYTMTVDWLALQHMVLVSVGVLVITALLGWAVTAASPRAERSGLTLASAVGNTGNMGIPINLFAFGEAGAALAAIYYAITSFLTNTLGVVVASAGRSSFGAAVLRGLQAPMLYAATLGLLLNRTGVEAPLNLYRAIDLLAGASIPLMLVLLGAQLRATRIRRGYWIIWRSMMVRLVASPLVALLLCWVLGIGGVERQVLVLQSAMPTAVITTVLATEFDAAPALVAAAVFFSTLASVATLSVAIFALG